MTIQARPYHPESDYGRIDQFLIRTTKSNVTAEGIPLNWLQPRWEYMHFHPSLDKESLPRIGVWEAESTIVGIAHYEHCLGDVFFEIDEFHKALKSEMIDYAEEALAAPLSNGRRKLQLFLSDLDPEFEAIASAKGFRQDINRREDTSTFDLTETPPTVSVPDGFRLISLAEDNDLQKIHQVLHRGFNHSGEPPPDEIEGRKLMQSAPNFRKNLTLVTVAPNGDFVSFGGMWYDGVNKTAYVEPVATDPDYRFLGLGKAVVLEGVRRCGELGAKIVYVGSGQTFYLSIGFRKRFATYPWVKYLNQ